MSRFLTILVAMSVSGSVSGQFSLVPDPPLATPNYVRSVAAADLNGDGRAEALAASGQYQSGNYALTVWQGTATGISGTGITMPLGAYASGITTCDVDGDLDLDVAVGQIPFVFSQSGAVQLWINDGSGGLSAGATVAMGQGGAGRAGVGSADLDGDGDCELVLVRNGTSPSIRFAWNSGGAFTYTPTSNIALWGSPQQPAIGDLDGDQRPDIVVVCAQGFGGTTQGLALLRNLGGGSFAPPVVLPIGGPNDPRGAALADLDLDGHLDIIAANFLSPYASILWNMGNLQFSSPQLVFAGDTPTPIEATDLDGDAWPDLAVGLDNSGSSTVRIVRNLGSRTFASPMSLGIPTGGTPTLAQGDFDGDGDVDLFAPTYSPGAATVIRNVTPRLFLRTPAAIGTTATVLLRSPMDPGLGYVCGFALSPMPGVVLPDFRITPIAFDDLFYLSVQAGNPFFQNTVGALDIAGEAQIFLLVPPELGLAGLTLHGAFLVIDPVLPFALGTLSPRLPVHLTAGP